jgi:hypothetical protein
MLTLAGSLLVRGWLTRCRPAAPLPRRPYAEAYAADEAHFFADYVQSHLKLSELGVQWEEGAPVKL